MSIESATRRGPVAAHVDGASELSPLAAQMFNRGNAAFRNGQWADALAGFDAALAEAPTLEPAELQRARCLVNLGQRMTARASFERVLRLNPGNYSAWLEAGHLCRRTGDIRQALGAYKRAADVAPTRHEAPLGMVRVLEESGEFDAAMKAFRHTIALASRESPAAAREAMHQLGRYRLERGDTARGLDALRAALAAGGREGVSTDELAEIQIDMGEALFREGNRPEALRLLTQAASATGEAALTRLAQLSFRQNHWQEAIAVSRRALALHPASAIAHWNLAHLLAECWQMDEAHALLDQAERLAPMPHARVLRATIANRLGQTETALALYQTLAFADDALPEAGSRAAMVSLYSDTLTASEVADLHCRLFAPLGAGARSVESFVRTPITNRRIRLGILSADFHHQHPVNIFMQPVLREMDKSRFEVFLYFTGVSHDEQTRLARSRVEHWQEVTTMDDSQLAQRIDADGIDLLLDLAGHTGRQRIAMLGKRAAPVQATYLGYPGSTGVPNIDWVIGDDVVTPPATDLLYSERVARLPGTVFCFAPEEHYPYPRFPDEDAWRTLTFGSFNSAAKLNRRTLALWARVLEAVPASRLVLRAPSFGDPGAVRVFRDRLALLGVEQARVQLIGPVGLTEMMAAYADIDIALDPVPYNGGTTTLQAMWMGAPVVTLAGDHFVSRMGASFMRAAGLPDWVAGHDDEYVAIACTKAQDRQALLALKRGLREELLKRPGWDVRAHTRALENALAGMARGGL